MKIPMDGKIMVVDADQDELGLLEERLAGLGHTVIKHRRGTDALRSMHDEKPDIAIVSLSLGDMDGLEFLERVKTGKDNSSPPVIMVVSQSTKRDWKAALDLAADDLLLRPIDPDELRARTTAMLRMRSQQVRLLENIEELRRLQALKDSLVQMLVHDFRNPLTGALGYLELLDYSLDEGKYAECPRQAEFVRLMINRVNSLVDDLLDLGRMEEDRLPLSPEAVDLKGLIEENIAENAVRLEERGIRTVLDCEPSGQKIMADRKLMHRVVGNILSNAIRYSPAEGSIVFGIRVDGPFVELSVTNEGPNIPEDALGRIFEKFYQVNAGKEGRGSGTGLGLAFCSMVVEAHGGYIEARNNPGRGCTFVIRLPVKPS